MAHRHLLPLLFLLSTALLDTACSHGGSSPADPVKCAGDGALCTDDTSCCSFRCLNGTCGGAVYACLETNVSCISGPQCCSGVCTQDGFCAIQGVAGTCTPLLAACGDDAECCSNNCDPDSNTCEHAPACSDDFVACLSPADCCSKVCDVTCQPVACTPAGQICSADHQCCVGFYCNGGGTCATCLPSAGACMADADCCSGTCTNGACK
jgi:hypothetical protein